MRHFVEDMEEEDIIKSLKKTIKVDYRTLLRAHIYNLESMARQGVQLPEICRNCGAFAEVDCGCKLGVYLCRVCDYDARKDAHCDCPKEDFADKPKEIRRRIAQVQKGINPVETINLGYGSIVLFAIREILNDDIQLQDAILTNKTPCPQNINLNFHTMNVPVDTVVDIQFSLSVAGKRWGYITFK